MGLVNLNGFDMSITNLSRHNLEYVDESYTIHILGLTIESHELQLLYLYKNIHIFTLKKASQEWLPTSE